LVLHYFQLPAAVVGRVEVLRVSKTNVTAGQAMSDMAGSRMTMDYSAIGMRGPTDCQW